MLYDLESHAKDGRCGLSRSEDIRRFVGKLVEKQTLERTFRSLCGTDDQEFKELEKERSYWRQAVQIIIDVS